MESGVKVDNIIVIPPDEPLDFEDEDSDQDEDKEDGRSLNHLGPGILRAQGEIEYLDNDDLDPDVQTINQDGEVIASVADETAAPGDAEEDIQPVQQPAVEVPEEPAVAGPSRKKRRTGPKTVPVPAAGAAATVPKLPR